jgi:hypothetical protein
MTSVRAVGAIVLSCVLGLAFFLCLLALVGTVGGPVWDVVYAGCERLHLPGATLARTSRCGWGCFRSPNPPTWALWVEGAALLGGFAVMLVCSMLSSFVVHDLLLGPAPRQCVSQHARAPRKVALFKSGGALARLLALWGF